METHRRQLPERDQVHFRDLLQLARFGGELPALQQVQRGGPAHRELELGKDPEPAAAARGRIQRALAVGTAHRNPELRFTPPGFVAADVALHEPARLDRKAEPLRRRAVLVGAQDGLGHQRRGAERQAHAEEVDGVRQDRDGEDDRDAGREMDPVL